MGEPSGKPNDAADDQTQTIAIVSGAADAPGDRQHADSKPTPTTISINILKPTADHNEAPPLQQAQMSRQTSSSSLAQIGRSASRSSIQSDTTASVCSSTAPAVPRLSAAARQAAAAARLSSRKSSVPTAASSQRRTATSSGAAAAAPQRTKATPNGRLTSRSSSLLSAAALSSSSGAAAAANKRVPTLAMSLRDKDQQIKLLMKERDEQKFQAELMAQRADQWREKFLASEEEKSHVTSEADDEVVELRRLAQEFEDENRRLAGDSQRARQTLDELQFKLTELEIDRNELRRELQLKGDQLANMEREQEELASGDKNKEQLITERCISKAKYERTIDELRQQLTSRDEQIIQLRSSLEMRKNEVANLQSHAREFEQKFKIETDRNERHLRRIDEINLELKASEQKFATKCEENQVLDRQVRQLRQELRAQEEKLEQLSLARKKDVDILHNKLLHARGSPSTSGTATRSSSPQPAYKTPTPQDEIVRLQMEIRDLKDQLIDREAELDCNRRDLEVIRRKMETRTLEVDCNNQELARRCQDLLEQNRQSEETVKQLLKSTTEHSAQLMRATDDLKEANNKCVSLHDKCVQLETKLDELQRDCAKLRNVNKQLDSDNFDKEEQISYLKQQIDALNGQLTELCEQLDHQTQALHQDREHLAKGLAQYEIELAQVKHDLATAKQDLRSNKLQLQDVANERDRLKVDLELKEKYCSSRNNVIETMRHELTQTKAKLDQMKQEQSDEVDEQFNEMRQKHSVQMDELRLHVSELEEQIENYKQELESKIAAEEAAAVAAAAAAAESKRVREEEENLRAAEQQTEKEKLQNGQVEKIEVDAGQQVAGERRRDEFETQIEFLNSVVVDMQRKCDDYKRRLAQSDAMSLMNDLLLGADSQPTSANKSAPQNKQTKAEPMPSEPPAKATIKNAPNEAGQQPNSNKQPQQHLATMTRPRHVRIQDPVNGVIHHQRPQATRISGRPYCDICSVYDLHHTIYCPKVSEKLAARQQSNNNNSETEDVDAEGNNLTNNNINHDNNNDNNSNNNNNYISDDQNSALVDELFREYEQSVELENSYSAKKRQQVGFASLRRPEKAPRPYCDHCNHYGHTTVGCAQLKV